MANFTTQETNTLLSVCNSRGVKQRVRTATFNHWPNLTALETDKFFDEEHIEEFKRRTQDGKQSNWYAEGRADGIETAERLHSGYAPWTTAVAERAEKLKDFSLEGMAHTKQLRRRRKRRRGDTGDSVDIHEVNAGRCATAWTRPVHEVYEGIANKRLTILVNVSQLATVGFTDTLWRAAAAMRVYEEAIQAGKTVKVIAFRAGMGNMQAPSREGYRVMSVTIKDFGEKMATPILAASCSAAFGRLNLMSRASNVIGHPHPSYGYTCTPVDPLTQFGPEIKERAEAGEHFLVISNCFSEGQARKVIKNVREQLVTPSVNNK